jgi:hypothetical protein
MPKCKDCGNTTDFILAYVEFEVVTYEGDKIIDQYAGDRERFDEKYPPECFKCNSLNIEGNI